MSEARVRNVLRAVALQRSRHYQRLFRPEEHGAGKRRWLDWFRPERRRLSRDAEIVLDDLKEFCRAERSTFDPDGRVSARNEGRREVWLRIAQYLELDERDVTRSMEVERD